jgi:cation diffusion facilitator CzcD-associated flavoprotein CzcO
MASVRRPHVLILGAGLGGLLLAQALRKQNITFDIFDRDESIRSRSQGWCIGIHGFFNDLETAMPDDLPAIDVTSHLRPLDLPAQLCFFGGGQKFLVQSGHEGRVIRAHRARLRDWLATNIRVNWKTKTTRIEDKGDSVTLHFADGSSATGDVLVGADGVNSMGESTYLFPVNVVLIAVSPQPYLRSQGPPPSNSPRRYRRRNLHQQTATRSPTLDRAFRLRRARRWLFHLRRSEVHR